MIKVDGFDHIGTIVTRTGSNKNGFSPSNTYTNVKSKKLPPLYNRFGEEVATKQGVSIERNSWLIRKEDRAILAKNMHYLVDSKEHHVTAVREYKGSRDLIVLDTEYRDN